MQCSSNNFLYEEMFELVFVRDLFRRSFNWNLLTGPNPAVFYEIKKVFLDDKKGSLVTECIFNLSAGALNFFIW